MTTATDVPDKNLLEYWLRESGVDFYECHQCAGLHFRELQEVEGVVESRLFLEPYGLLLTTELEVRPMALMHISADLGRLNMDYPILKLFLDVVDDAVPQLAAAAVLQTGVGVTPEQFSQFTATTVEATRQLAQECKHLDYLYLADDAAPTPGSNAVH
jgi:hypothetical protein